MELPDEDKFIFQKVLVKVLLDEMAKRGPQAIGNFRDFLGVDTQLKVREAFLLLDDRGSQISAIYQALIEQEEKRCKQSLETFKEWQNADEEGRAAIEAARRQSARERLPRKPSPEERRINNLVRCQYAEVAKRLGFYGETTDLEARAARAYEKLKEHVKSKLNVDLTPEKLRNAFAALERSYESLTGQQENDGDDMDAPELSEPR